MSLWEALAALQQIASAGVATFDGLGGKRYSWHTPERLAGVDHKHYPVSRDGRTVVLIPESLALATLQGGNLLLVGWCQWPE